VQESASGNSPSTNTVEKKLVKSAHAFRHLAFYHESKLLPRVGDNQQPVTENETEEVPMKLNDSISTYDVAEALQGESGKFEVTSPNGERYFVTCLPGHSIASIEWAGSEPNLQPFLVRKVAQPVTTEGRTKRSAAA
jgi:hypothetical protein